MAASVHTVKKCRKSPGTCGLDGPTAAEMLLGGQE